MSLRRPLPLLPTSSESTLGISLKPLTPLDSAAAPDALLSELVRRNGLQGLSYAGCAAPCTLLASGEEAALDALRSVWARGALRAPQGYAVQKLGDVSGSLWLHPVAPAAFAPLSDALLHCMGGKPTSAEALRRALRRAFPRMRPPDPDALHAALGQLVRERKICHNGQGYLLVQSCSFGDIDSRLGAGGRRSLSVQVDDTDIPVPAPTREVACQITQVVPSPDLQRVHSLKASRARAPPDGGSFDRSFSEKRRNEFTRLKKGDKQGESVLSKLLRRMQQSLSEGGKSRVTFSAQFPPPEWADQVTVGHSVATQTLLLQKGVTKSPIKKHDIPWMDTELDVQNFGPCFHKIKPRTTGPIPHRSSSRRRHHRRRSSSESPKSRKLKNRSNDPSDAKVTLSSSSGEPTYQKDSNKSDEYKGNETSIANRESKSFRAKPLLKSVAFQTPRKVTNDYVLDTTPPLSIDEDTGENATPSLASEFDSSLSAILSDPKLAISEDSSSLISTPPARRFFQPSTLLQNRKNTGKDSNNVVPRMPYCIKDHKNGTMKAISNVLKDNPHYGTLNKNGLKEKNHYGTLNPNILRTICPQNVHRPDWRKSGISLTPTVLKNNQVNPEKKTPNSPPEKDTPSPLAKGNALTWRYPLDGYTPNWKERLSVVSGSKDGSKNNTKIASRETPEGNNTSSREKSAVPSKLLPSYHSRPPVLKNLIDIPVPRKSNLSNDAGGNQSLLVKNTPKPTILKKLIDIPSVKTTSFSKDLPPLSPLKPSPNAPKNSVLEATKSNDKTLIFESPVTKTDILISHHPQDLTKALTGKDSSSKNSENTMENSKSVVVDNSVSIEVEVQKKGSNGGQSPVATVVTEETTTVSKGKVVTVTSVTTSLSHGAIKDLSVDAGKVNDLNVESKNVVDCSSSCNIVTEVK